MCIQTECHEKAGILPNAWPSSVQHGGTFNWNGPVVLFENMSLWIVFSCRLNIKTTLPAGVESSVSFQNWMVGYVNMYTFAYRFMF